MLLPRPVVNGHDSSRQAGPPVGPLSLANLERHGRRFSRTCAPISSRWSLMPTFLIVGAQRSGTTSLFKTLIQHPLIAKPFLRKGIHYFDKHYDKDLDWYRGHFPLEVPARLEARPRSCDRGV